MTEVKFHGTWPSPFSYRVIWALALKAIPYENIEEDLANKSPLLLQYNPVHKKIPVLVHAGKSIYESFIILQYIDDTWPENPLLPSGPLQRAAARFWIKFIEDKSLEILGVIDILEGGEDKETVRKSTLEVLKTVEEQALGDKKFFGGDEINMVDLAYGFIARWLPMIEEVMDVKILEPNTVPRLYAWAENFRQAAVIRDNLPDHDMMVRGSSSGGSSYCKLRENHKCDSGFDLLAPFRPFDLGILRLFLLFLGVLFIFPTVFVFWLSIYYFSLRFSFFFFLSFFLSFFFLNRYFSLNLYFSKMNY